MLVVSMLRPFAPARTQTTEEQTPYHVECKVHNLVSMLMYAAYAPQNTICKQ